MSSPVVRAADGFYEIVENHGRFRLIARDHESRRFPANLDKLGMSLSFTVIEPPRSVREAARQAIDAYHEVGGELRWIDAEGDCPPLIILKRTFPKDVSIEDINRYFDRLKYWKTYLSDAQFSAFLKQLCG